MLQPLKWFKQNERKKNLVKVESLSHDGRGVIHVLGKTTFVQGALPGETITFQITKQRGSYNEAQILEILTPSPYRTEPRCPHFGICGGCSQQYLDPTYQISFKQKTLQDLLLHQAKLEPKDWLEPISSPAWGYRRKARLGVKYLAKKDKVIIGFRERKGRLITDCSRCEVLHPSIGERLPAFSELISTLSIRDNIPQLEIAVGDQDSAVVFRHLKPLTEKDLALITHFSETHALQAYLQPRGNDTVHVLYPKTAKPLSYTLSRYHLTFEFQPLHFVQINAFVNEAMVDLALALLDIQPNDRILDLFCGIGNFSLPMARLNAKVTGVEGDLSAVQQAIHNAALNQLNEVNFHKDDLFAEQFTAPWAKQIYDKMLLDPPRAGASAIVNSIQQWRPKRIVYVSCDLATLARDAQILHQQGYTLMKTGIMDMFPHTQHAEAISLFVRNDCNYER